MKSIPVRYKGGVFCPLNPTQVSQKFKEGELYFFKANHRRYWPRHQWFMATIRSCWENLPENLQVQYPNPDFLRKRLLIACGYADITSITYNSEAEATRTAQSIGKFIDEYAVMSVQGSILVIATAKSQAIGEMDADTFKQSCDAVLDHLAIMLGTSREAIIEAHEQERKEGSGKR